MAPALPGSGGSVAIAAVCVVVGGGPGAGADDCQLAGAVVKQVVSLLRANYFQWCIDLLVHPVVSCVWLKTSTASMKQLRFAPHCWGFVGLLSHLGELQNRAAVFFGEPVARIPITRRHIDSGVAGDLDAVLFHRLSLTPSV